MNDEVPSCIAGRFQWVRAQGPLSSQPDSPLSRIPLTAHFLSGLILLVRYLTRNPSNLPHFFDIPRKMVVDYTQFPVRKRAMNCPKCHAETPEGSDFCGNCGHPIKPQSVCTKCGFNNLPTVRFCIKCGTSLSEQSPIPQSASTPPQPAPLPASFANGRYVVKKFLGEGGKKKVYLAHDTKLDRDVAFALIKTETLDETARTRIEREA